MIVAFNTIYYVSCGVSLETISLAIGVAAILNIVIVVGMSAVLDRIEPAYVLAVVFIFYGLNCLVGAWCVNTFMIFSMFTLTSLMLTSTMTIFPVIYGNYFGNAAFPQIQGFSLLISGLASSTTGIIAGTISDSTGSYSPAYYLYGILALTAAAVSIFIIGRQCRKQYIAENTDNRSLIDLDLEI